VRYQLEWWRWRGWARTASEGVEAAYGDDELPGL